MSGTKNTETLTAEEKVTVIGYAERVHTIGQKMMDTLIEDTADLNGRERWSIMSRVIAGLFSHHFMMSTNVAGVEMAKRGATPPPDSL